MHYSEQKFSLLQFIESRYSSNQAEHVLYSFQKSVYCRVFQPEHESRCKKLQVDSSRCKIVHLNFNVQWLEHKTRFLRFYCTQVDLVHSMLICIRCSRLQASELKRLLAELNFAYSYFSLSILFCYQWSKTWSLTKTVMSFFCLF